MLKLLDVRVVGPRTRGLLLLMAGSGEVAGISGVSIDTCHTGEWNSSGP